MDLTARVARRAAIERAREAGGVRSSGSFTEGSLASLNHHYYEVVTVAVPSPPTHAEAESVFTRLAADDAGGATAASAAHRRDKVVCGVVVVAVVVCGGCGSFVGGASGSRSERVRRAQARWTSYDTP